ncbi:peptidoglycan-binding protein [Methylorubrum sp. Q1]|uniref:peptidoglycan-binding domain-containing protein n=1 Tax=Methylorubrum sp. Q1 TaxID=2562453 RepID=UPI00107692E4|nr:peptidoglycan-binding domain-containing protein [Methylorubrum sp. Q1]TFZ60238.1 peptidoglycan-binding protein [Methylorubrum sp. Q1]
MPDGLLALVSSENEQITERGDIGPNVVSLQSRLKELGYYKGTVDGLFGGGTEIAIMDFQRDAGIGIDGRFGPETKAKLSRWPNGNANDNRQKGRADVVYKNQYAIRNRPCTPYLEVTLASAVFDVFGAGFQAQIYSGGQPRKGMPGKRVGSIRHDDYGEGGRALDAWIVGRDGNRLSGRELGKLGQYWLAKKYGGCGLEMAVGGIHLDEWKRPPRGGGMYWTYPYLEAQNWGEAVKKMLEAGHAGKEP